MRLLLRNIKRHDRKYVEKDSETKYSAPVAKQTNGKRMDHDPVKLRRLNLQNTGEH